MVTQTSDRKIALLSIQPRFVDLIISGKKQVEFRRMKFRHKISHIVVYATKPIQRIKCFFEVIMIDEAIPERLWNKYRGISGLGKDEFLSYFKSCDLGIAIKIGNVKLFRKPISLSQVGKDLVPPQSFSYLKDTEFQKISKL